MSSENCHAFAYPLAASSLLLTQISTTFSGSLASYPWFSFSKLARFWFASMHFPQSSFCAQPSPSLHLASLVASAVDVPSIGFCRSWHARQLSPVSSCSSLALYPLPGHWRPGCLSCKLQSSQVTPSTDQLRLAGFPVWVVSCLLVAFAFSFSLDLPLIVVADLTHNLASATHSVLIVW